MKKIILFFVILILNAKLSKAQLVDIDRNLYKTIKISNQTWMAENLAVTHFRNGYSIPMAKSWEEWEKLSKENKPVGYFAINQSGNKNIHYTWYTVNDPLSLAPIGWHIPHYIEWKILRATPAD